MTDDLKFAGESDWESIINHNSLDIVAEESFRKYVHDAGYDENSEREILLSCFRAWEQGERLLGN